MWEFTNNLCACAITRSSRPRARHAMLHLVNAYYVVCMHIPTLTYYSNVNIYVHYYNEYDHIYSENTKQDCLYFY